MSSTTEYIPSKTAFDKELNDIESAVLLGPQEYQNFFEAKKSVLYNFMKEDMDVDSREYVLNVMPITIRISVFKDQPEWAAEYLDSLEPLDQGLLLLRFDEKSRENIFKAYPKAVTVGSPPYGFYPRIKIQDSAFFLSRRLPTVNFNRSVQLGSRRPIDPKIYNHGHRGLNVVVGQSRRFIPRF
jgi:hypothetical protein